LPFQVPLLKAYTALFAVQACTKVSERSSVLPRSSIDAPSTLLSGDYCQTAPDGFIDVAMEDC